MFAFEIPKPAKLVDIGDTLTLYSADTQRLCTSRWVGTSFPSIVVSMFNTLIDIYYFVDVDTGWQVEIRLFDSIFDLGWTLVMLGTRWSISQNQIADNESRLFYSLYYVS